ncbi:hypothetical protein DKM27_18495 [Mycobacterium tuberculosis variant bovis]|nr:hypothetical protein DKM27_18825 [Mycobacterium tuberculosis variant bovis]TXA40545.1 hypothetical protein DKM27_18495 [Mycobacterium tuberculosis variant bovis]
MVEGSDGSPVDRIGALAVDDIEDFWRENGLPGGGAYSLLDRVTSYDGVSAYGDPTFCGIGVSGPNAMYCIPEHSITWDRVGLLPTTHRDAGDMGVVTIIAHEIGHAVDAQVEKKAETLRGEQRADCYAGAYLRWVAQGSSPRFSIDPLGIDKALETLAVVADNPGHDAGHGILVERVWAAIQGFRFGAEVCADTTENDIKHQRSLLPTDPSTGEARWTRSFAASTAETVSQVIGMPVEVSGTCYTASASWCPNTNSVAVNLAALQAAGEPALSGVLGDGSGLALLTAALVTPWMEKSSATDERVRACAVGYVAREMSTQRLPIQLSQGDPDEMLLALTGQTPGQGFTTAESFLNGLFLVDALDGCLEPLD